jgi:effector-binding domain-containing protein
MWWIAAGVIALGAAAWGPIMSDVEQAKYTVVEQHDRIEIRDYEPMIIAEVDVSGEREDAINQGFRMIADYIFGNNISSQKVAMTTPVTQQPNEKIAMTAPVIQQPDASGSWKVRFVMPSSYTMETLPKPKNDSVKLKEIPAKRYVAVRFSGLTNQTQLDKEKAKLEDFIADKQLKTLAPATYAFFNPPWTLPPLRRNEVMIEIKR